jgi:two-component sensor histidine kinase
MNEPGKMFLTFRPNVDLITSTRRFVNELLDSMLTDPDASSRVALTIHELLENTLKYSMDGEAQLGVALEQDNGQRKVEVRSSNRATPEQMAELQRRIDALKDVADPMGLYVSMMVESTRRNGSGLGLVRIRVEGEMQLTYVIEGDQVTIKCSTPVE